MSAYALTYRPRMWPLWTSPASHPFAFQFLCVTLPGPFEGVKQPIPVHCLASQNRLASAGESNALAFNVSLVKPEAVSSDTHPRPFTKTMYFILRFRRCSEGA